MSTTNNRSISRVTPSGQVVVDVHGLLESPEVREVYRTMGDIMRKRQALRRRLQSYRKTVKDLKR